MKSLVMKRLGRKPATFSARRMRASLHLNAVLANLTAPPPVSYDWSGAAMLATHGDMRMFLNDQIGDCTAADSAHALMVRTAAVGSIVRPTNTDVLRLYEATSGYIPGRPETDVGCVEADVCSFMMSHGLLGHRSVATAPVVAGQLTPYLIDNLKWAVELFGPIRLGVNLPRSAEAQFEAGLPWTVNGDLTIAGGHDILLTRYNTYCGYVMSWGQLRPATWQWLERFVEEAHIELFPDLIKGKSTPNGFSLSTLTNELRALSAE